VVRAVLVAGHHDTGDAVVGHRPLVVVGLGHHPVHPLQHPLRDRRGTAEPGGRGHDQDLGVEQLGVQPRPVVGVVPDVGRDAGRHDVVDDAERPDLDVPLAQPFGHHVREDLGVRRLGTLLERAIQDHCPHGWLLFGSRSTGSRCPDEPG
jgi:hypothetical protein